MEYKLVPNENGSPNPTFSAMMKELSPEHPVRKMHGMGHKEELIASDLGTRAEEGKVFAPGQELGALIGMKAINASPHTTTINIRSRQE